MFGRDEKVSSFRLTAVQYFILVIFLVLAYGLWRLQVVSSDFYSALAEKNKTREVPILAPRGKILDRDGRTIVDNYPSFTALLLRDSTRDLTGGRRSHRPGAPSRSERSSRAASASSRELRSTSPSISRKTLRRRLGLHQVSPQRTARAGHHHGPSPSVSAQRLYGAPGRICRRSQRGHAEPAAVGALQPGRRGGEVGRGAAVQPDC